ncbi:YdcF family protein [Nocardia asteroides]|uniref:YdcF family protein n=1 Tax=Nocardia asteroides TaxID=1824 RepID=UPI001E6368AD|nr:YdcF family protein [Nocardia asteroides]UGT57232.1 YdcF family protein [Nocardia asteroides]
MVWVNWVTRGVCAVLTATGFVCAAPQAGIAEPSLPSAVRDLQRVLTPGLPATYGGETAVVILGYGLTPEGVMRAELVRRLRAGFVQAMFAPWSPIIVTGGNPRAGLSEADAMADWLVSAGIDPARILREPHAESTVANARNTAVLMSEHDLRSAVLVTSSDHLDRARAAFDAAGVSVVGQLTPDLTPWPSLPLRIDQFGPALPPA